MNLPRTWQRWIQMILQQRLLYKVHTKLQSKTIVLFCKKHGHNIDQCHTLQKIVKIASGKQRNQDQDRYQPYDRRFDKDDSKYDRRDYKPSYDIDRHRGYDSDRDYQPRNYDNRDDHRRKDYDRRDNRNDRSSHHRRDTRDNGNWEYSKTRAMAALAKYQAENRKIAFSAIKPTSDHRDSDYQSDSDLRGY